MTDEAAFLRAIIERPDDDVPRLVFCDWLDEHGQPERAEFVRVQVELAGLKETHPECSLRGNREWWRQCKTCNRAAALRRRERELTDGIMGLGVDALPIVDGLTRTNAAASGQMGWYPRGERGTNYITAAFTRGFVSAVTLSWADWVRHSAALLAACPLTGKDAEVRLTTWPELDLTDYNRVGAGLGHFLVGLVGRRHRIGASATSNVSEDWWRRPVIKQLLDTDPEWAGVAFSLPEPRSVDGLTAREVAERMNAAMAVDLSALSGDEVDTAAHLRPGVAFRAGLVHADPTIFQVTPEARP